MWFGLITTQKNSLIVGGAEPDIGHRGAVGRHCVDLVGACVQVRRDSTIRIDIGEAYVHSAS